MHRSATVRTVARPAADGVRHQLSIASRASPFRCLRGELTGSRWKVRYAARCAAIRPCGRETALVPPFPVIGTTGTRQIRLTKSDMEADPAAGCAAVPENRSLLLGFRGLRLEQIVHDVDDVDLRGVLLVDALLGPSGSSALASGSASSTSASSSSSGSGMAFISSVTGPIFDATATSSSPSTCGSEGGAGSSWRRSQTPATPAAIIRNRRRLSADMGGPYDRRRIASRAWISDSRAGPRSSPGRRAESGSGSRVRSPPRAPTWRSARAPRRRSRGGRRRSAGAATCTTRRTSTRRRGSSSRWRPTSARSTSSSRTRAGRKPSPHSLDLSREDWESAYRELDPRPAGADHGRDRRDARAPLRPHPRDHVQQRAWSRSPA